MHLFFPLSRASPCFSAMLFFKEKLRGFGLTHKMHEDALAEWLRRRPAKPVGSARVGSNPTGVVLIKI